MKQVFISIFLIVLMSMVGAKVYAYDIAVENTDGVTICYNYINDGKDLEVTHSDSYKGTVVIPEEVTYMNRTRKVTSIGYEAFRNCSGLTSVTIPNSVTSIGRSAFEYCSGLISVTIGNNLTNIEAWAFSGCNRLTSVHISDIGAWCKITFQHTSDSNPLSHAHHLYMNGEEIKDLVIPNSVESIGNYAFCDCFGLTSVTIPNSVTSIGHTAFYGCSGLTSVTIGNSVTSIGFLVFSGCSGLTSVTIPNSVTSIGYSAFHDCSGLTSVTIPNSVTSIGEEAFSECSGLTSVTIPNSVTSIGKGAFLKCSGLTSLTIGNSVMSIGEEAFLNCSGLTSVTIPNSVTSIGKMAFLNCSGLTSVTMGNNVTSIGEKAFYGCDIPVVISLIENPFAIANNTFSNNTFMNASLYVPAGTMDKYKATDGWKGFIFIEEGTEGKESGGGTTAPEKCEKPAISYSNGKLTFTSATEGATCQYNITDNDVKAGSGNVVQLTVTYNISVYAAKDGYENSETVTATLCWIDVNPKTEGIENSIASVRANPVLIQSNGGVLNISGINDGTDVVVYSVSGHMVGASKASGNQATVFTNFQKGEIAIVKIGDKSVKVVMK